MSRPTVEDEWDDDTDLPLPNYSLPNTGTRGAILEEISSDEELDPRERPAPQPVRKQAASTSLATEAGGSGGTHPGGASGSRGPGMPHLVHDATPYKRWTSIYPIYIDAKRAFGKGQRRIARKHSVWWPQSVDIAAACASLGLRTLHEPTKTHPQDWDNAGRVKVQWKENGRLANPIVRTKKQLLTQISLFIQRKKPDLVPSAESQAAPKSDAAKGPKRTKLPRPPAPIPPLTSRFSEYSPAQEGGMLVDAVKAAIAAEKGQAAGEQGKVEAAPTGAVGKGKRKVVRISRHLLGSGSPLIGMVPPKDVKETNRGPTTLDALLNSSVYVSVSLRVWPSLSRKEAEVSQKWHSEVDLRKHTAFWPFQDLLSININIVSLSIARRASMPGCDLQHIFHPAVPTLWSKYFHNRIYQTMHY